MSIYYPDPGTGDFSGSGYADPFLNPDDTDPYGGAPPYATPPPPLPGQNNTTTPPPPGQGTGPNPPPGASVGNDWFTKYPWLMPYLKPGVSMSMIQTDPSWDPSSKGKGIFTALALGKTGEDAVNWANQNFGGGYAYRNDTGTYSLPGGGYVGKNGENAYFYGEGDSAGGGGGVNSLLGPASLGPLIQPWTTPFTDSYPTRNAPAIPTVGPFAAPTPQDVYNDPSFKFREDQAAGAVENAGASQGRGLEGGFLKGLSDYISNFASQEYGNLFNRDLTQYTTNRDTTLGTYNAQVGAADKAYGSSQDAYNAAYKQYLDNEAAFRANQNGAFDKLYSVSNLGANTAGTP